MKLFAQAVAEDALVEYLGYSRAMNRHSGKRCAACSLDYELLERVSYSEHQLDVLILH